MEKKVCKNKILSNFIKRSERPFIFPSRPSSDKDWRLLIWCLIQHRVNYLYFVCATHSPIILCFHLAIHLLSTIQNLYCIVMTKAVLPWWIWIYLLFTSCKWNILYIFYYFLENKRSTLWWSYEIWHRSIHIGL